MPDAEVILETERPGYRVTRRTDAGGRFVVDFSAIREKVRTDLAERIVIGTEDEDLLVREVVLRAIAGDRCSPPLRLGLHDVDDRPLLLLLRPCAAP